MNHVIGIVLLFSSFLFSPGKEIDPQDRWRHSARIKPSYNGPDKPFDILYRNRDSFDNLPFQTVVKTAIEGNKNPVCTPAFNKRCSLAANSPGRIGEVYFDFKDAENGVRGHSSQILIACRCLDYNCGYAIVMQPRLTRHSPNVSCFYPKVNGKWRDCHTEILRTSEQAKEDLPEEVFEAKEYRVKLSDNGFWSARGKKRIITLQNESEIDGHPKIDFKEIVSDFHEWETGGRKGSFLVFGNDRKTNSQMADQYFLDKDHEKCGTIFTYARKAADRSASLQDHEAVGMDRASYLLKKPGEVTLTDAVLAIGTGFTGLFTAIGIWAHLKGTLFEKEKEMRHKVNWWVLSAKILIIGLVIPAEIGSLIFAFFKHNAERNWRSFFAFFDGLIALPPSVEDCDSDSYRTFTCSAEGGVYISLAVLGTVGYFHPTRGRWLSMLIMMILLTTAIFLVLLEVSFRFYRFAIDRRNDPRFSGDEKFQAAADKFQKD